MGAFGIQIPCQPRHPGTVGLQGVESHCPDERIEDQLHDINHPRSPTCHSKRHSLKVTARDAGPCAVTALLSSLG